MLDRFKRHTPGLESPPSGGFQIAPSDTENLPQATRALNFGVSGAVRVLMIDGSELTLNVVAGTFLPIRTQRVFQTGTTASQIVGLY